MKHTVIYTITLILLSQFVFAQNNFKIIRTDNNNYPEVKVYVKTKDLYPKKEDFRVVNDSTYVDFTFEKIEFYEKNPSISVFLLIDIDLLQEPKTKEKFTKLLTLFKHEDNLNMALFKENKKGVLYLNYLSAEFSTNYLFFIKSINNTNKINKANEYKNFSSLTYDINNLISTSKDYNENKSLIIISKNIDSIKCDTNIQNKIIQQNIPVYFALFHEPEDSLNINEIIKLCKKTGGIFTKTNRKSISKDFKKFIEDISPKNNSKNYNTNVISFKNNNDSIRHFELMYKNNSKPIFFNTPQFLKLYKYRKYFFVLVALSLSTLFLLLTFYAKKIRKLKKQLSFFLKETIESESVSKNYLRPPSELILQTKGFSKTFIIRKEENILGRNPDSDFEIPDTTVSGYHAEIKIEKGNFFLKDLSSTNGTFINGKKIEYVKLKNNDKIKLGSAFLIFKQN